MAASSALPFSLEQCQVKFTSEAHDEYPRVFKNVYVDALHPREGRVGSLVALQVDRERCRGSLLEIMDEESQELSDFALTLFDKFGRLKPELAENEYLKGTGVWGRELDQGPILYVLSVDVQDKFRRNGVGSLLLDKLAHSAYASAGTHLFAWPSPSIQPDTKEEWERQRTIAVELFHKNHYRRVGRTSFLAYAPDSAHPSRALPIGDDLESTAASFQPGEQPVPLQGAGIRMLPDGTVAWGEHQAQDINAQDDATYPLHHMIEMVVLGIPVQDMEGAIRDAYSRDVSLVRQKDDRGFTPLHVSAYAANLAAAKALLALPAESGIADDLRARDNVAGRTPLELCEQKKRELKEMMQTIVGNWPGHNLEALHIVWLLKRAVGEDVGLGEDEFVNARRWGCTCGQCTEGWLSPRMRFRLRWVAEVSSDTMDVESFGATSFETFSDELAIEHLPAEVRATRITKTFYREYATVVRTIADVLKKPGLAGVPTAANVEAELVWRANRFFGQGGKVEHAMDYVLRNARDQSPLGDGTWDDLQSECAEDGSAESVAYNAMPACDNDLEFIRVADRLALGTMDHYRTAADFGSSGFDDDSDDEMDEDEDEDEMEGMFRETGDDRAAELEDMAIVNDILQAFRAATNRRT
ncbi:hypothetical protein OH77DRAFT_1586334 [Trametes cingulata]|nr:hypothetical protein OH77DRAFT_1586334 [Trametes cingulata]